MSSLRCVLAAWLSLALAACAFEPAGAPGGGDDDAGVDAGGARTTLRDDLAADFAGPGTRLEDAVIEPWGSLAPAAYHVGGLLARLDNASRFDDLTAATWADVVAGAVDGTGFALPRLERAPVGVGLGDPEGWTYWLEGELWLEAGEHQLWLRADDAGFVELAAPGTTAFTRVTSARYFAEGRAPYLAARAGWYPVRIAMSQHGGDAVLDLRVQGPAEREPQVIAPARLRARVDGLRGTELAGWDGSQLYGVAQRTLYQADLVTLDVGGGVPPDLGIGEADYWSVRWSGQFYVTHPGTYRFRIDSDDGQRLYLGGGRRIEAIGGGPADRTVDVELAAGWTDLVLDHSESTGSARARLRVVASPDPELGELLPRARLRPVVPRGEQVTTAVEPTDAAIADDGVVAAESKLELALADDAVVTSIDVGVSVDHPRVADLEVRLVHPDGSTTLLRDNDGAGGNGARTWRFTSEAFDGKPARGTYRVRVLDTASGQSGRLTDFALAVHHRGGPPVIAPGAAWTSAVRDLGDGVRAIDRVRFGARIPAGAGVQVRLRACDLPDRCADEPWSIPVTTAAGAAPRVTPRRYLQYRIELASDGEREPELDWIEIDYRREER